MWVRVSPPAHHKTPANEHNFYAQKVAPHEYIGGRGSSRLTEGILHRFGRFVLHVGQHVRVGIECYGDASMA